MLVVRQQHRLRLIGDVHGAFRLRPIAVALAAAIGAGAATADAPSAASTPRTKTITYSVERAGAITGDFPHFKAVVDATLNDPRGWSLGGRLRFRRAARGAIRLTLAAPSFVGRFGACSAFYSCRSGARVLINDARWQLATASFPGRSRLHLYRQMAINHEVGHALGFGHASCAQSGRDAPVMMQQSKGLGGCAGNAWPVPNERTALARRRGVRAMGPPPRLVLGESAAGVSLGDPRGVVLARLGYPQRRRDVSTTRSTEVYTALRLRLTYARGRVTSIATRSAEDRTADGLAVGRPIAVVGGVLREAGCDDAATIRRCVIIRAGGGGQPVASTVTIRGGRVSGIRVGRDVTTPSALLRAQILVLRQALGVASGRRSATLAGLAG